MAGKEAKPAVIITLKTTVFLGFLAVYILFPSGMSTVDGWNYAAEIKHSGSFFYPWHLLYNPLGFIVSYIPSKAGFDVLACLKVMNAVFAALSLLVVQQIIRRSGRSHALAIIGSAFAGASFAVMRFATENETYILPLLLGLAGTYYYICCASSGDRKNALLAGLFMSLSVLFHAISIFWWAGLLAGFFLSRRLRGAVWYMLVSLSVPAVYLLVIFITRGSAGSDSVQAYLMNDLAGNVHLEITLKGAMLSAISLVRSFIQVHGYMFSMIKHNLLLVFPALISIALFAAAALKLNLKLKGLFRSPVQVVILLVIVLQFLFALFASGNAEFMVMIPVLAVILICLSPGDPDTSLVYALSGMLVWNLVYGMIPLRIQKGEAQLWLAGKALENRRNLVIAADDQLIQAMIHYRTGVKETKNVLKSPAVLRIRGLEVAALDSILNSALKRKAEIYTDCLSPASVSRAKILQGRDNSEFFSRYESELVFSRNLYTGTGMVHRITGRKTGSD